MALAVDLLSTTHPHRNGTAVAKVSLLLPPLFLQNDVLITLSVPVGSSLCVNSQHAVTDGQLYCGVLVGCMH